MKLAFYNKEITDQTLLQARGELLIAVNHLLNRNYGLATEWIEKAMGRLPEDTGEEVVWADDEAPDVTTFDV